MLKTNQMVKLRKCTILGKVLVYSGFDDSNTFQKLWQGDVYHCVACTRSFFLTTVQKHLGTEQLLDFWESNVFPFLFGRRWICLFVLRAVLCVQYQDGNNNQNLLKSKILQGGRVVSGSASGINSLPTQTCRFIHCGNKKAPKVPSAVHQGGSYGL